MTIQSFDQRTSPYQGWASAYRDYRALMSCNAEISSALIQKILKVEESHCDLLETAWSRDKRGKLFALNEQQFDLIYAAEGSMRGMLFSIALEFIKAGKEGLIDREWLRLATLYQLISEDKCQLFYQELRSKDPEHQDEIRSLSQMLVKIRKDHWDLTGFTIY